MIRESKCAICRHLLPKMKDKLKYSTPNDRRLYDWKKKCSESLCQVVLGSVTKSFRQYFKTGEYCSSCLQTIRDINLTWSQLKCLEDRLNKLSHAVLQNLKTNYDAIEKKTNPEIVEDHKNFLESYSDDQRIEIIYLVASRHAALSATIVSLDDPIKQDMETFTESEKEEEKLPFPLEVKLEENDKVDYIDQSVNDFEEPPVPISAGRMELLGQSTPQERQSIRTRKRKIGVKHNNEEASSADEDESDQEYFVPNDFVQSDCESNESFNPNKPSPVKSKQNIFAPKSKSPPPRKKNKYSKYVKKVKVPVSSTVKCPTCHKTVSRNRFPFHQRTHTGEKPFSCPDCGMSFSDKSMLWKHARLLHGKLNPEAKEIKRPEIAIKVANESVSRKRRYYCDICSWDFNYQYRYLRHLKDTHLNKEVNDGDSFFFYYCDVDNCLCSFTSLTSLNSHFLNSHSVCLVNNAAFECNVCKRMFVQENNLQTHMKSHEENNFGCEFCYMKFSSFEEMKNHKHRHEIKFKLSDYCHMCAECGEGFTNTYMLTKHTLKSHKDVDNRKKKTWGGKKIGSSKFFCNICQKGFHNSTLKNHMYIHTHPEGFKCLVCPEIRSTPKLLMQHEERDHKTINNTALKIKCDICQKKVSKSCLEYHMKSHTSTDSNGIQCPHCDTKHKSSRSLQYHLKRVHPQDLLDLPSKFITDSYKTKCEICDKKLSQNKQYHKHLVEYHPEEYEATHPYVCRLCWRVFRTEEDRQFHVEKAHDSYKCSVENCGKIFPNRKRLLSHLNIHYKQKPYECPYCGKCYAQDANCRSHINTVHIKHRSLRCKLCPNNEGYFVRKEFSKHVQNVHPEIPQDDYSSALDYRKAPASAKIIVSNVIDCYLECPPVKRQSRKP